jgi:hypothetical protein
MSLNAPKQITFWVAVILAVLGILGQLGTIAVLSQYSFWLVVLGFVLLAAGTMFKDL